jgi:enoyl-CoA hydratase
VSVLRERRGPVEIITLNRPEKRNALDAATIDALGTAFADVEADDAIRAVVLTGAGDRAFCAGMDLNRVGSGERTGGDRSDAARRYMGFLESSLAKPVIAAANGAAVAGGFELLLACDLAVAAEHAVFGVPEVQRGLIPGGGATLLPARLPRNLALELAVAAPVTAQRAYEMGLLNRVVPADQVLDVAVGLAEAIARNGPTAVRLTRQLMAAGPGQSRAEQWAAIRAAVAEVMSGPEAAEGARAFLERRAPNWG